MSGLHVHDLRHTGNQFTAHSGARLRDLMTRMGQGGSAPQGRTLVPTQPGATARSAVALIGIKATSVACGVEFVPCVWKARCLLVCGVLTAQTGVRSELPA